MRTHLLSFSLFLSLGISAAAQDSSLPSEAFLGVAEQAGGRLTAAVDGHDPVYLAQGRRILVISDPGNNGPQVVHVSDMAEGIITSMTRVDDWLIAGWRSPEQTGMLGWYSLSEPLEPRLQHVFAYNGEETGRPNDLATVGNTLYVMDHPGTPPGLLFPVDVSDPASPRVFEPLALSGQNPKLAVFDEHHLLRPANSSIALGVRVLDISDPHSPEELTELGSRSSWGGETDVLVGDNYIVLQGTFSAEIISLEDPAEPEPMAEIREWMRQALLVDDHLVYANEGRLRIWDLGVRDDPVELGEMEIEFAGEHRAIAGTTPDRALFFDTAGHGIELDLSDPAAPAHQNDLNLSLGTRYSTVEARPQGMAALSASGALQVTTSGLRELSPIDSAPLVPYVGRIAARPDGIALATVAEGLQIIDVSGPEPAPVSEPFSLGNQNIRSIDIDHDRAWILGTVPIEDTRLVSRVNLSDPANPVIEAQTEPEEPDSASVIRARDGRVYMLQRRDTSNISGTLWIYHADPDTGLVLAGKYEGCDDPARLDVRDTRLALICDASSGSNDRVQFLDVSDPAEPVVLGRYPADQGIPLGPVRLEADRAWLATRGFVDLVDLEDPADPFLASRYTVPSDARFGFTHVGRDFAPADNGVWVAVAQAGIARLQSPHPLVPGHSALWYNAERDGEGWVIEMLDADTALGYWFTYDDNGNQQWLIGMGRVHDNRIVFEMDAVRGGRFGPDFDPDEVEFHPAGTVRMRWTGCNRGWFSHHPVEGPDWQTGFERLTRPSGLSGCDSAAASPGSELSGSWYDPELSGQGFTLQWLGDGRVVVNWFTFDPEGNPYWLIGVGESQGDALVFPELTATRGARFGEAFDAGDVERLDWGRLVLRLTCTSGSAEYESNLPEFGSGSMVLTRLTRLDGLDCD